MCENFKETSRSKQREEEKSQQTSRQRRQQLVQSKKMHSSSSSWVWLGLDHVLTANEPVFWKVYRDHLIKEVLVHLFGLVSVPLKCICRILPAQNNHTEGDNELWYDSSTLNGADGKAPEVSCQFFRPFFFLTVNDVKSTNNQQESLLNTCHFTLSCYIFFFH